MRIELSRTEAGTTFVRQQGSDGLISQAVYTENEGQMCLSHRNSSLFDNAPETATVSGLVDYAKGLARTSKYSYAEYNMYGKKVDGFLSTADRIQRILQMLVVVALVAMLLFFISRH